MSIKNFLVLILFFVFNNSQAKLFTIMLNPAGDAKDAGRTLNDSFERGITLQFTNKLKTELEKTYKNIRVVITRMPGETLEPLQNANFANRLDVDFYLSIHFYKEKKPKPQIFLFRYLTDTFSVQSNLRLYFYKFDTAHLINISQTINCGNKIKNFLNSESYKNKFDFFDFLAIPFKPLVGIKAPAIAIEIGLKNTNDWQEYIPVISESFQNIIQNNSMQYG